MELVYLPKTREAMEPWQLVLRGTLERIGPMRLTGDSASEYFWTEWRAAMLASGATERDIAQFAAYILCRLANLAPERCLEQADVIVEHPICTEIEVQPRKIRDRVRVFELDRIH